MAFANTTALLLVALAAISSGEQHRSTAANNLTASDRGRIAELGLRPMHAAAISIRNLPSDHKDAQMLRLRELGSSAVLLAPSDICDRLAPAAGGTASCTGRAEGPIGDVPVRMTIGTRFEERPNGGAALIVFNTTPLEAKSLFGWTKLVKVGGLKLAFELDPVEGHWVETTRMGVSMDSHTDSAERIAEVLAKLDAWLARDTATR